MNEPTSSRKIAKAARRQLNKDYRKTVEAEAREMGRLIGNSLKPKPRWVPWKLWLLGLSIFMKVK